MLCNVMYYNYICIICIDDGEKNKVNVFILAQVKFD